jgi:hypothetical protein
MKNRHATQAQKGVMRRKQSRIAKPGSIAVVERWQWLVAEVP